MADLSELQLRLENLRKIRAGGIQEVSTPDDSIRFKTDQEIAAAIRDIERQIAAANHKPIRRIIVGTTKGF